MAHRVGVRGDFGKLEKLWLSLKSLIDSKVQRAVNANLGEEAKRLLTREFRESHDPYQHRWAPLARARKRNRRKGDRGKPLVDTGRLRNSFTYHISKGGFLLGTNVVYAATHQYGSTTHVKASHAAVDKRGRFMSHAKARKQRSGSVAIRPIKAHTVTIPKRQMVPERELGPVWWTAFEKTASRILRKAMKG